MPKFVLYTNITYRCDCSCLFCAADIQFGHRHKDLALESLMTLLEEKKADNNSVLIINGGEPFLHPDIVPILQAARNRGVRNVVMSNGNALQETSYAETVLSLIDTIEVPIFTLDEKLEDQLTGKPDNLMSRMSGLRNLFKVGRRYGTKIGLKTLLVRPVLSALTTTLAAVFDELGNPDYFTVVYPNISKSVLKHLDSLLPSYGEVIDPVQKIMIQLLERGIPFEFIRIPLCLLLNEYRVVYALQAYGRGNYAAGPCDIYLDPIQRIDDVPTSCFPAIDSYCEKRATCNFSMLCPGLPNDICRQFGRSVVWHDIDLAGKTFQCTNTEC